MKDKNTKQENTQLSRNDGNTVLAEGFLVSMLDFILETEKEIVLAVQNGEQLSNYTSEKRLRKIFKYANFLKQSLKLEMFVPCDINGNILKPPKTTVFQDANFDIDEVEIWNKAQSKILFEGFSYANYQRFVCFDKEIEIFQFSKKYNRFSAPKGNLNMIEDLMIYNFKLTQSALSAIFG